MTLKPSERQKILAQPTAEEMPTFGPRIETPTALVQLNPPKRFVANYRLPRHIVAFHFGTGHTVGAVDSDRLIGFDNRPGLWSVTPAGSTIRAVNDSPNERLVLAFDPGFLDDVRRDQGGDRPLDLHYVRYPAHQPLTAIAAMIRRHMISGRPRGRLLADSLLTAFAASMVDALAGFTDDTEQRATLSPRQLADAVAFMDARIGSDIALDDIAASAGMAARRFAEAFKATTGQTVYQHTLDRRVDRARERLARTDEPIAAIAYACGFASQSHMTDVFRSRLDITPGRYRRQMKS